MIYDNPYCPSTGCASDEDVCHEEFHTNMPSEMNIPRKLLLGSYQELYAMETLIARSLPVLSGSVMNVRLRKLLTTMAFGARERRDWLADRLRHHGERPQTGIHLAIGAILNEGNRELSCARDPFVRDGLMIRHCVRIGKHARLGYGIVSRLAENAGVTADAEGLSLLLSEMEAAGTRLARIGFELCPAATCGGRLKRMEDLPWTDRNLTHELTKTTR